MEKGMEKFLPQSMEDVATVKKKLSEVKDEWLETKPGRGSKKYLGVNTIRQILDHAVAGITYWDFEIEREWIEQVNKFDKNTNSYVFDGFVFHVKASLFIGGIGKRSQFGSKVAVGGKDNQDSAFKAAASNAFNKCASLFGVGESIYSTIKVDMDEEPVMNQQMNMPMNGYPQQDAYQMQADPMQMNQQYQQPQYQEQPQQYQQQNYQQPPQQEMPQQWQQNQQQQPQWGQPQQEQQQMAFDPSSLPRQDVNGNIEQAMDQVKQNEANGYKYDIPFNQAESPQAQPAPQQEAQPNQFQATENSFQPVEKPKAEAIKIEHNDFNNPAVQKELARFQEKKNQLGLNDDEKLTPLLRDYFKDENATLSMITPESLPKFNDYLETVQI